MISLEILFGDVSQCVVVDHLLLEQVRVGLTSQRRHTSLSRKQGAGLSVGPCPPEMHSGSFWSLLQEQESNG